MTRTLTIFSAATICCLAILPGCREENTEALSLGEAQQALDEASMSSQAGNLMSGTIELSTSFTIGQAVENAAQEIGAYVASQLPCAEVTLSGATLEVEYGVKPGNCVYRGHAYSGSHSITVTANDAGQVIVEHQWDELSNGVLMVSGSAQVTWDALDVSRHVVHELTWTRLKDGRSGVGTGDRVQRPLEGGLSEGFEVNGDGSWTGSQGTWDLAIDGVQIRWADPVPQAGTYTLVTPDDKEVVLSFEREDEDTIVVTLQGPQRSFTFKVNSLGAIDQS